jgi:hypothetical protein
MPPPGQIILETAATLITLGGLYDLLTPKLPPHLIALCKGDAQSIRLARELLRALGGALISIGITAGLLATNASPNLPRQSALLILALVLPAEGINSLCMHRVGSPFYIPVAFAFLTLAGVLLSCPLST